MTGGFAFYLWYKTITTPDYTIPAGDFVITLGGYHPAFQQPVYYPTVPRLGLSWKMDVSVGSVSIAGGAYFAICPTAVMAGGYLNVSFEAGPLKAWLNAYANFLIEWNPFYFNIGIGISVGASFGTTIAGVSITLKVELGAKLQLEGPPTHGHVEVDWYVISFTIPIGDGDNATKDRNLDWDGFAENFLPTPTKDDSKKLKAADALNADPPVQQVVKWSTDTGLLRTDDATGLWTVNPVPFAVSLNTAIPANTLTVTSSSVNLTGRNDIGVRPMGLITQLQAPMTITVKDAAGKPVDLSARQIKMTAINNGAPSALWSQDSLNRTVAPDPDKMIIPEALFGLQINADHYVDIGNIPVFKIDVLKYDKGIEKQLPFEKVPAYPAAARYPDTMQQTAYQVIMNSIMTAGVVSKRNAVLQALNASAVNAPQSPDLTVMAASANLILQALPVIGRIGIYQNGGAYTDSAAPVRIRNTGKIAQKQEQPLREPELRGILKRYRSSAHQTVNSKWSPAGGLLKTSASARNILQHTKDNTKTLHDGSAVVWKTDERGATTLTLNGDLPLTVAAFNTHGALLALEPAQDQSSYDAAPGTALVAVQALGNNITGRIGWQGDTLLTRINEVWAMGDGYLLRVQNSQRIAVNSVDAQTGIIEAAELIRKNEIQSAGNVIRQGWIQTVFATKGKHIGVLVTPEEGRVAAVSLSIDINALPMQGEHATLVASDEMEDGKTLFIYEVKETDEAASFTGVFIQPVSGQVSSVFMLPDNSLQKMSASETLDLHQSGLDLADRNAPAVHVSITTKPMSND